MRKVLCLTILFFTTYTVFSGGSGAQLEQQADVPPNIILIITDDQGYGDLACHGNPILKTPHLDRLHEQSIRFTDFHVSPTCSPSRSAIMTGQFTNRTGCWHTILGRSMLRTGRVTLGDVFRNGGFATGLFGKWHLGDNYPYRPQDRGFDEVVWHLGGGIGQTPDHWNNAYFDDTYDHNGTPTLYEGYCTEVFFREAKRFIAESVAKKKPFFACITPNAPHGPYHCPDEYWKPYQGLPGVTDRIAVFFGMIQHIDDQVGALRAWLKTEGLDENTLLIFSTDNGTASGSSVYNSGMRGRKGSPYEGGHRVPLFMYWPAGGLDRGKDISEICAGYDLMPTLIELCKLPQPTNSLFDGVSLAPLITGTTEALPKRVLFTDSQRVADPIKWRKSATMTKRWRLINGEELYDMTADPGQTNNVEAIYPEVVARLRNAYTKWWEELEPTFSEPTRIIVGHPKENPSVLTAMDWITDGTTPPWNQAAIREAKSPITGYWNLFIESDATYRIILRRWPQSVDAPICGALPPEPGVQGLQAHRERPGKGIPIKSAQLTIGDLVLKAPVKPTDSEIHFTTDLPRGNARLQADFMLESGEIMGAYYVYVEKIDG